MPDLFDELDRAPRLGDLLPAPRQNRPTSIAAAERITPRAGTLRRRVYDAIAAAPDGMTDEELAAVLDMSLSTARARRIELTLEKYGLNLVRDSGRTRPSRGGNEMTVWVVKGE